MNDHQDASPVIANASGILEPLILLNAKKSPNIIFQNCLEKPGGLPLKNDYPVRGDRLLNAGDSVCFE